MKYVLYLCCVMSLTACKQEPYLKHTLTYTKVADNCASGTWNYKLVHNTNGDRYEFNECLAINYNGAYNLTRRGDTLDVQFTTDTTTQQNALFALKLDVDTWPAYSHIYLGEQLMKVTAQ